MAHGNYTQIENAIIDSPNLSNKDKIFYVTLKRFRNRQSRLCFPSMRKVAQRAGISIRTAYSCRKKLKKIGLVYWTNERGRNHSCHYRFMLEEGGIKDIARLIKDLRSN